MEPLIAMLLLIPVGIGVLLSPQAAFRWLFGLVLGGLGYAALTNALNAHYGLMQYRGDMDFYPFVIVCIGAILGSVTGLSVLLHKKDRPCGVGLIAFLIALPALTLYALSLFSTLREYHTPQYHPIEKALAASGPGLLWSLLLVLRGMWLICSPRKEPSPPIL